MFMCENVDCILEVLNRLNPTDVIHFGATNAFHAAIARNRIQSFGWHTFSYDPAIMAYFGDLFTYTRVCTNGAAIVVVGENLNSRDIVLKRLDNTLKRVYETHRSYDALQYPLIIWQEEDGYHFLIKMINPLTGE